MSGVQSLPLAGGFCPRMSKMSRNTSTVPKLPCTTREECSTSMQRRGRPAARIRQVLLVEGYMDLLAFHAKGFYRVAATLGTALTSQQVRLLSRMCDEVVLAYDGDDAGERAMLRALPLFLEEELSVSCIRFPEGLDPDDFLKKFGLSELERLIEQSEELGAYTVRKAVSAWDGSSAGRAQIFSELKPVFQKVRQPLLKSEYLRIIADRFSITEEVAEAQLLHEKRGRPEPARRQFRSVNLLETAANRVSGGKGS